MAALNGIFDGFEGYQSPTDEQVADAVTNSLVVLDTNVLLNLYNYQGVTLQDFLRVFAAIGDRLFVPHQVMDEFWRNRLTVLKENQGKHREYALIENAFDDIDAAFRRWHARVVNRVGSPPRDALRELDEAKRALLDFMSTQNDAARAVTANTPTHEDHVLASLSELLDGRVGPPPSSDVLVAWNREGKDRLEQKIPPGYMDAGKQPERAIGDFLVWRQTVIEAKRRVLPVVLVTDDHKEDWWAGQNARPELVREMLTETGHGLVMIRGLDLVKLGGTIGVEISEVTLNTSDLATDELDGWTPELVDRYLDWLYNWAEHYAIFIQAVEQGGVISRKQMAKLLGRKENDSMQGTGRPFHTALRRLTEEMEGEGELEVPLAADYGTGGWMTRFIMPPGLLPVFAEAATKAEAEAQAEAEAEAEAEDATTPETPFEEGESWG